MKNVRKILSLVLVFSLLLGASTAVSAEDALGTGFLAMGFCGEDAFWKLDHEGVLTISGTGSIYDYSYEWRSRMAPWAEFRHEIVTVIVSEGITHIGNEAFGSIWLGGSLPNLQTVVLPSTLEYIGDMAFACAPISEITLPDKLVHIGNSAFSGTSIASVNIGENVSFVGYEAFETNILENITVAPGNNHYVAESGVLYDKAKTEVILYPLMSTNSNYTIPETVNEIDLHMFWSCESLKSITVPAGVMVTNEYTPADSYLSSLDLNQKIDIYFYGDAPDTTDWEFWTGENIVSVVAHQMDVNDLALANTQTVLVDGESVTFEVYALEVEGGMTNYIKLRDLAYVLNGTAAQFEVAWDGAVNILDGQAYTPNGSEMSTPFSGDRAYRPTDAVTKVDGVVTEFDAICLEDDDGGEYNYYKLRDLGKALGFDVSWSNEGKYIYIETDQPYTDD